jgi:pimeloyl-ACP methyl ester carboxylesterase
MNILLVILCAAAVAQLAIEALVRTLSHRRHRPGAEEFGGLTGERPLVILVEGIRWSLFSWDRDNALAGLRLSGYAGDFHYWKWHEDWRAWLVLPVIAAPRFLERRANELAEMIRRRRAEHPRSPVYLVGISCGGYLLTRALELLPEEVQVDGVALIGAAMNPWRNLSLAAVHVLTPMVVTQSYLDWQTLGLGTLITGTADRRHRPSMGMLGPRGRGNRELIQSGRMHVLSWRPRFLKLGNCGGHLTAASPVFIAQVLAPKLLCPADYGHGDDRASCGKRETSWNCD